MTIVKLSSSLIDNIGLKCSKLTSIEIFRVDLFFLSKQIHNSLLIIPIHIYRVSMSS